MVESALSGPKLLQLLDAGARRALVMGRDAQEIVDGLRARKADVQFVERVEAAQDLQAHGVAAASLDLLVLSRVLEQTYDPGALLEGLRTYLVPGAQILASVPNIRNLWFIREIIAGRWTYKSADICDPTSIRFFTLKNILLLFANAGFTVHRVDPDRDPRITGLPDAGEGQRNVEIDIAVLKGMKAEDIAELSTREFLVSARA